MTDNVIFWFRHDLRISDNIALTEAISNHKNVFPLYIYDETLGSKWKIGSASKWWLHYSLLALQKELPLNIAKGATLVQLLAAIKQIKATTLYINTVFEPAYLILDMEVRNALKSINVEFKAYNSSLIFGPKNIKTTTGKIYNVFTPFWKKCLANLSIKLPLPKVAISQCKLYSDSKIERLKLLPVSPNWASKFEVIWQPGEINAYNKLNNFIANDLKNYKEIRNIPEINGTSRLSPHLHFGEISHIQIWHAIKNSTASNENKFSYLNEIGWREFSSYLLYHYPKITDSNFKTQFDRYKWENNLKDLKLWQQGMTGYPIVDAGMRELWNTGYMHNRVRMIVASFLTKDLLIDWRRGAEWFWDTLVDADLAANSMNWQWVAGSGPDAAQYYRIFNPTLQGEKFDPKGNYIRKWIPELKNVPNKYIHKPWETPKILLTAEGITIPGIYPKRIVDHQFARKIALEKYKNLK